MKLLFTTLFAFFLSLLSFTANAQVNTIDSGIHSIAFEGDDDEKEEEPKPGEEPECD